MFRFVDDITLWTALEHGDSLMLANVLHGKRCRGVPDSDIRAFLDKRNEDGFCPLHFAAETDDCELIRMMLEHGATVDVRNEDGDTPLHTAASSGKVGALNVLLKAGASTSAVDKQCGYTALHCAAQFGHLAAARVLGSCSNLNARAGDKRTALHIAVDFGRTEVVKVLLMQGCALHLKDGDGWTALHYAASKGHGDIARALLEAGEKVNARDSTNDTPLHVASANGHAGMVALLKTNGADLAARNDDGHTPYEDAKMGNKAMHEKLRSLLFDPALVGGARRAAGSAGAAGQQGKSRRGDAPPSGKQQSKQPSAGRGAGGKPPAAAAAAGRGAGGGPARAAEAPRKSAAATASPELAAWLRSNDLADHVLPLCAQLGLTSLADVVHVREEDLSAIPVVARRKFVAAAAVAAVPAPGAAGGGTKSAQQGGYVPMPFPAVDNAKNFDAHAEAIAVAYMRRALGFTDAATTGGIHTSDGGVDVVSSRAVAQVKANFRSGAIKRGPITQLIGDTSPPSPFAGRKLLFFAVSYTDDAVRAAKERGIRLFTMDSKGVVTAV